MAASYPTSAKSFTTKNTSDTIQAAHVNDVQDEITAIENDLLGPFPVVRGGTGLTAIGASGTVLSSDGSVASWATPANAKPCQGRLSLTTGVPVTTADVTAAGTLYWVPYQGNQVALYSGSAWVMFSQAELSIAVPAVATQVYDVFIDYNGGTPALSLTAWTNDTTRATALTTQDGVYVLTGSTGKRYVGTVRTVTASQLNDSVALRHVWNYYNRKARPMRVFETTDSWAYTTSTMRQANGSAANQLDMVVGVDEDAVQAFVTASSQNATEGSGRASTIGLDSTTARAAGSTISRMSSEGSTGGEIYTATAVFGGFVGAGRHILTWLEYSSAGGTTTWWGDGGSGTLLQSGIQGVVKG